MAKFIFTALFLQLSAIGINAQYGAPQQCNTPQYTPGTCIGIRSCPSMLAILQSRPLTPQAIDYLRQSQCGFEGKDPKVCCPASTINSRPSVGTTNTGVNNGNENPPATNNNNLNVDLSQNPLLPSDCGRDLTQKIVGGEETELDEFPWMALLEYRQPNGRTTACGGVLINRRYVLTAAHCIKGKDLPSTWRLTSVRLGEYDTSTNPDCVQDDDSDDANNIVCADEALSVGVEEQIAHEQYKPLSRDQKNDIALLRLNRDVPTTTFIKPICLPSSLSFGEKIYVAGWGKTENNTNSNIKLKLSLPLADKTSCARIYNTAGVRLGNTQVCAGGTKGKDSCRGDSGGPLMALDQDARGVGKWTAVGIVSFGPSPCGMEGWPGVYTRVIDYVPWILSKLRA